MVIGLSNLFKEDRVKTLSLEISRMCLQYQKVGFYKDSNGAINVDIEGIIKAIDLLEIMENKNASR